jgi:ferritin
MVSEKMSETINKQVNAELYSAYLYLSMQTWFDSISLPGFANWVRVQAMEEFTHADRLWKYLVDRGVRVEMQEIPAPPTEWKSPLAVFEAIYAHEQKVTGLIENLVNLALEEKDHATANMLQWFVSEQVEEESSADAVVQQLKLMGEAKGGLFMIDRELGQRVFTPPPAEGE